MRVRLAIRSLNNARKSAWICGSFVHTGTQRKIVSMR